MIKTTKTPHWIQLILTIVALTGFTGLCQAQSPIVYNFASSLQGWSLNEPGGQTMGTMTWNATGGSTGGGCMQLTMDGTNTTEFDPIVTLPTTINMAQYISVTVHMMVASGSGQCGNENSDGYGYFQVSLRNSSYSWNALAYGTLYPPAANSWVTYTFITQNPYPTGIQYLQLQQQIQGTAKYTGPVTVYIDNISINPLPDPYVLDAFTSQDGGIGTWDQTEDAPFYNPVTGAGPTNFTPAGSWEIQIADPGGYNGWNQYQPTTAMDFTRFEHFGMDVFLDGSSGSTYGGFQIYLFNNNWSDAYLASVNFNASMVGKWTHFDFPAAAMGSSYTAAPAFSIQGTPGTDGGTATTTFHVDNLVFWSPQTQPKITSFVKNTVPGGVNIAVDGDGTANQYDQEGISTPAATNAAADFFWIGQTPATYSFTLTNFPPPSVAPGFDAHFYVVNGDSIQNNSGNFASYNEGYSGVNYNAVDAIALDVMNGTNGGVNVNFTWKTNTPSSNITNGIFCTLSNMTSANGAWALNFSDNTHASITLNGTAVTNFTVPDFSSDPNYNDNFSPLTSEVAYGVWKNDVNNTGVNDNQSAVFTAVQATNTTIAISDDFSGPGLTANYAWQINQYYQDQADRVLWIPANTAYLLTWNATAGGFTVQSSTNLMGTWSPAGVTYTYPDTTGTNTVGTIPAASLPPGGQDFFNLSNQ